jgi:hypothetical protein
VHPHNEAHYRVPRVMQVKDAINQVAGKRTLPNDTASINDIKGSERGSISAGPMNLSIDIVLSNLLCPLPSTSSLVTSSPLLAESADSENAESLAPTCILSCLHRCLSPWCRSADFSTLLWRLSQLGVGNSSILCASRVRDETLCEQDQKRRVQTIGMD